MDSQKQANEHKATRAACGFYDFSFMGAWEITGSHAIRHLEQLQSRDLAKLSPGQIAYTLMCRDDGTVFNDATVWKFSEDKYWLWSGRKSDAEWVNEFADIRKAKIEQIDPHYAVLAVQGPHSGQLLASLAGEQTIRDLAYFRFTAGNLFGKPCQLGRIGYSGELGYEIVLAAEHAANIWRSLLESGKAHGLVACGFEAANSLRIESGYILFSHELAKPRLPDELGLARLVKSSSAHMRGHAHARQAALKTLVCVELQGNADGAMQGQLELTSQAWSPLSELTLGLGFTDKGNCAPGSRLRCEDGAPAKVCQLPRYDPARLRPKTNPLS